MVALELFRSVGSSNLLAYLDPSSGSMAFQIIVAGLLSSMFFVRSAFSAIKQRFFSTFSK